MTGGPSVRDVALDPQWLPHAFERDGRGLTSVFVPRAARSDLLFLSDGHFRGEFRKATFPAGVVAMEAAAAGQAPLHFIFHTSFCCSTLLAKALGVRGVSEVLMEPNVLVDIAERPIRNVDLELALRLIERPLEPGDKIIVKPSNFANRVLEPALAVRPESRAVLLYSDPGTFLRSIIKRGLLGRINARKLYSKLSAWTSLRFGFSEEESFLQTDLQIAALAWLMQIAHFQSAADRLDPERMMFVDSADILSEPAATLQHVQTFFGLGLGERQVAEIADGPVFATHSKSARTDYNQGARVREHEALLKAHGEELEMVLQWLNAVAGHVGVPLKPAARARTNRSAWP
jgi:hypothetical protein